MRTEKEIRDKILELKEEFLLEDEISINQFSLRDLKRTIKILNWVLGREWLNNKQPALHGNKSKKW